MMSPDRMRAICDFLDWSHKQLAYAMNEDYRLVRRWSQGAAEIDAESAAWLEMQAANPPPRLKRRANYAQRRAEMLGA